MVGEYGRSSGQGPGESMGSYGSPGGGPDVKTGSYDGDGDRDTEDAGAPGPGAGFPTGSTSDGMEGGADPSGSTGGQPRHPAER